MWKKNVDGSSDIATDVVVLPLTSAGTLIHLKVGSIIASKSGTTTYPERMKVISISGLNIGIERGVNGTTADIIAGGRDVVVVLEKSFNTRKFKLLEVNRDGYSAKIVPSGLVQQSNDPNSIHFATKEALHIL